MFFYVKKEDGEKCPYCGFELIENYQSKDNQEHNEWGGCCERHPNPLPLLEKNEVGNFYTHCEKCKKWIKYEVNKENYKLIEESDS